ncbi:MAG: hypothetical protein Q8P41_06265 [Pseudomonadota bacterium]|nr:hypothetical protein [Pseudomonadota bacterium]
MLGWSFLLALAGCFDPLYGVPLDAAEESAAPAVAFPADVETVFATSCAGAGCHVGGAVSPKLGEGYDTVVDVPSSVSGVDYVEPGDPAGSYLYAKLDGTAAALGGGGGTMPLGGALSDADLEIVYTWILDGALPAE